MIFNVKINFNFQRFKKLRKLKIENKFVIDYDEFVSYLIKFGGTKYICNVNDVKTNN
jgi:ribonuclease PH